MKRLEKFIIGILLVAVFFFGAHLVFAIEYGGLGIFPSASEVDEKNPLTKAWFIYTLESGELKKGRVSIRNTSPVPVEVRVYPVDAVTTRDGAFAPEPEDKERVGVGAWVTLAESKVYLSPGETKIVNFTMRVPNTAEVGDHIGAIIVQSEGPLGELTGSGLRIATRVGVRMYITVPGDIVRELVFSEFREETQNRIVTFYPAFSNRGNVRIRLKGTIEVTDISGVEMDVVAIPEREVFPGKEIIIPVEWNPAEMLRGKFIARAVVRYDNNQSLTRELNFSVQKVKKPFTLAAVSSLGAGISIGFGFSVLIALILYAVLRRKLKNNNNVWYR